MSVEILCGDARAVLAGLPAASVHACVTSPPYFNLRSYGGGPLEIGTEGDPREYVAHLVDVFRGVWRVLRDDGTCWVVIGDSYCTRSVQREHGNRDVIANMEGKRDLPSWRESAAHGRVRYSSALKGQGLKDKDLMLIPHRVAIALQDDGWYVRNDCVWAKGSAMPESAQDRFSRAHEYVFHLAKSERYYFDAIAVAEKTVSDHPSGNGYKRSHRLTYAGRGQDEQWTMQPTRNRRSVLHINPQAFSAADFGVKDIDHYAVFPEKLVEILTLCSTSEAGCCPRCLAPLRRVVERATGTWEERKDAGAPMRYGQRSSKGTPLNRMGESGATTTGWQAGCSCDAGPPIGCTTLDPFLGSGTVALVSKRLGRSCVGIELNESYVRLSEKRIASVPVPLFSAAALADEGAAAR